MATGTMDDPTLLSQDEIAQRKAKGLLRSEPAGMGWVNKVSPALAANATTMPTTATPPVTMPGVAPTTTPATAPATPAAPSAAAKGASWTPTQVPYTAPAERDRLGILAQEQARLQGKIVSTNPNREQALDAYLGNRREQRLISTATNPDPLPLPDGQVGPPGPKQTAAADTRDYAIQEATRLHNARMGEMQYGSAQTAATRQGNLAATGAMIDRSVGGGAEAIAAGRSATTGADRDALLLQRDQQTLDSGVASTNAQNQGNVDRAKYAGPNAAATVASKEAAAGLAGEQTKQLAASNKMNAAAFGAESAAKIAKFQSEAAANSPEVVQAQKAALLSDLRGQKASKDAQADIDTVKAQTAKSVQIGGEAYKQVGMDPVFKDRTDQVDGLLSKLGTGLIDNDNISQTTLANYENAVGDLEGYINSLPEGPSKQAAIALARTKLMDPLQSATSNGVWHTIGNALGGALRLVSPQAGMANKGRQIAASTRLMNLLMSKQAPVRDNLSPSAASSTGNDTMRPGHVVDWSTP